MTEAGKKLRELPSEFGDWKQTQSAELSDGAAKQLQCTGYVNRSYMNGSGQLVHVAVITGPAGPLSLHDPEICYRSTGYQLQQARRRVAVADADGTEHELWSVSFRSPDVLADSLRVYYARSSGDKWEAVDHPRVHYATKAFLYKIQLATSVTFDVKNSEKDAAQSFLRDFTPFLKKYIVKPDSE